MIPHVKHFVRLVHSKLREAVKRVARSPHWSTVEKHWKNGHPSCAACGSLKHVQVHHVVPFHHEPLLELADGTGEYCKLTNSDGSYVCNLISLCMDKPECHLRIGHGGDFHWADTNVRADAAEVLAHPDRRSEVEERAKKFRVEN